MRGGVTIGISEKFITIKQEFDRILKDSPDIKGIILLSDEGLVVVSTFDTGDIEEPLSAMTIGIKSCTERFLNDLGWSFFSAFAITGADETIWVIDIGKVGLLVLLTEKDVKNKRKVMRNSIPDHINNLASKVRSLIKTEKE
ncbi:MAG: hypothetical protein GY749_34555 [Desulfobacteraceae bacterium]|nr:hypothetical protein [Desulfobacteraceae bacterium]